MMAEEFEKKEMENGKVDRSENAEKCYNGI